MAAHENSGGTIRSSFIQHSLNTHKAAQIRPCTVEHTVAATYTLLVQVRTTAAWKANSLTTGGHSGWASLGFASDSAAFSRQ